MKNQSPLTDLSGEVRELNENDFKQAVSFSELPESLQKILLGFNKTTSKKLPITQQKTYQNHQVTSYE